MCKNKQSILIVGNFQSTKKITNPTVSDQLAQFFAFQGWKPIITSTHSNKVLKLINMVSTCYVHRDDYCLALIDVYSGLAFIWAEIVSTILLRLEKPYVLTLHGGNLPKFAERYPKRVKNLLKFANAVTTPSDYLLNQMSGFRPDIRKIHNPLDIRRYQFKQRKNLTTSLIWLRAFHHIYNPILALHTINILRDWFPQIRLTMVGPDKNDGSLHIFTREMSRLNLEHYITLAGYVPKKMIPNMLQSNDIFLNTTNIDNTPVSVIEALSSGLCVVSTNVGGIPYLLHHEEDSLLVPPQNPEAMAEAVRRLIIDSELAELISYNARKKAELFDWTSIFPKWLALFEEITS